jgi:hypothetical protein
MFTVRVPLSSAVFFLRNISLRLTARTHHRPALTCVPLATFCKVSTPSQREMTRTRTSPTCTSVGLTGMVAAGQALYITRGSVVRSNHRTFSGQSVIPPPGPGDGARRPDDMFEAAQNLARGQAPASTEATQTRTLTMYANGFTIDDGPFRPKDDPENQAFIKRISEGYAVLHSLYPCACERTVCPTVHW